MEKGSLVGSIDVAQVVLYTFWVFFIGLIFYLRREDKREGYPLVSDRSGAVSVIGFPSPPSSPKTFLLPHGGTASAPSMKPEPALTNTRLTALWQGAPREPTGNPMLGAVGPGSYAMRSEQPDLTVEGHDKIVPMRVATDFVIGPRDPDPRGMAVIGADREVAGTVSDVWVDRGEIIIRYLEVAIAGGKRVLLPWNMTRINTMRGQVMVTAILASQFADVPALLNADRISLREEDRIMGYYGGGYLYATPARAEPLL